MLPLALLVALAARQEPAPDPIPLDFIPADFVATSDGKRIVAIEPFAAEAVIVSSASRAVERRIKLGVRPRVVAEVGSAIWVGDAGTGTLLTFDPASGSLGAAVPLPSIGTLAIAVSANGRVFVATKRHLMEVDPAARAVKRILKEFEQPLRESPRLSVRPDAGMIYLAMGGSILAGRTDGPLERSSAIALPNHVVPDGRGWRLLGNDGVYDPYLRPTVRFAEHESDILAHPDLPFAFYFHRRKRELKALDLHELTFGAPADTSILPPAPRRDPTSGEPYLRARLSADGRAILVALVQPDPPAGEVAGTTSIWSLPSPVGPEDLARGYFAFASLPPAEACVGVETVYDVRFSGPFDGRVEARLVSPSADATLSFEKRRLRWTPGLADVGRKEIRIRADDPVTKRSVEQTLLVDVRLRRIDVTLFPTRCRVAGDGRYVYDFDDTTNVVRIYDLERDRESTLRLPFQPDDCADAGGRLYAFNRNPHRAASCSFDGTDLREIILADRTPRRLVARGRAGPMMLFAWEERDGKWSVLSLESGRARTIQEIEAGSAFAVSPDGSTLLVGRGDLVLCRFQGGRYEELSASPERIEELQFGHDGTRFRMGARIYETRGMRLLKDFGRRPVLLDPTGPYCLLPENEGRRWEVVSLADFSPVGTLEVPAAAVGGDSISRLLPLLGRKVVLAGAREGAYVVPWRPP